MQERSFRAMGCEMRALIDADGPGDRAALIPVERWFHSWERALSRFRDDSELSQLNRRRAARVSSELWEALQSALHMARLTDGLVSPVLLDAVEAAGYDRTFDELRATTPPEGQGHTSTACSHSSSCPPFNMWQAIQMRSGRMVALPAGARLDLGGSAKGWVADLAARRVGKRGAALVDAGGDIAVSGPRADGSPWPIGITDPLRPDKHLALLLLPGGGVATSGRDYRRWRRGGAWQHHIIDPRSGAPAETDVISATVVGPSTLEAEAAAKAALILGGRDGLAWIDARPQFAGLLVLEDGTALHSRRMPALLWQG